MPAPPGAKPYPDMPKLALCKLDSHVHCLEINLPSVLDVSQVSLSNSTPSNFLQRSIRVTTRVVADSKNTILCCACPYTQQLSRRDAKSKSAWRPGARHTPMCSLAFLPHRTRIVETFATSVQQSVL